jgi:hypothetical protein
MPKPTFMYGPKDGALVPDMLWVLDMIEMIERIKDGEIIHCYEVNQEDKNYYYVGQFKNIRSRGENNA